MRLLLTRPADEAARLAVRLAALGHVVSLEPVLRIAPLELPELADRFQAVLLTSRHAGRALARRPDLRTLPVLTVGDATAAAARDAGCSNVVSAAGDVEALARLALRQLDPSQGPLLYLSGRDLTGNLADGLRRQGFRVARVVAYRAQAAQALSAACQGQLRDGTLDAALFFSPRSAGIFVDLVRAAGLLSTLARLVACCISDATAEAAAAASWHGLRVATEPSETAMVELLDDG